MQYPYSEELATSGLVLPVLVKPHQDDRSAQAIAKIDTGADISAIPRSIMRALRLSVQGHIDVRGSFDKHPRAMPTCFVRVSIDDSNYIRLEAVVRDAPYLLLGRDWLNTFVLLADGPQRIFELR